MTTWFGHISLAIAFVILATVVLWFFIKTPGKVVVKVLMIPATIWYGLALYYAIPNLMGWPTTQMVPDNSHVIAFRIKEPNPLTDDAGAIFIWADTQPGSETPKRERIVLLNPKTAFDYHNKIDPRTYKLPYSRQAHRAILNAQKQMSATPGSQMRIKIDSSKQGSPAHIQTESNLNIEITNPIKLLPK